mgnify:CR=1 FL=1
MGIGGEMAVVERSCHEEGVGWGFSRWHGMGPGRTERRAQRAQSTERREGAERREEAGARALLAPGS